ncbi:probable inactive heme oxygenase 2, chloroplastic [Nymphaea colorata]|nr:probable inactive heme oxygenase 2, chloroplastic [Nymphaea colorata]
MLHCSASCMLPKSGPSLAVASCVVIPFHAALPSALRVPSREGLRAAASGSFAVLRVATAKKRKRYRKPYPGEAKGIVEEMRFVAMRLRNKGTTKVKQRRRKQKQQQQEVEEEEEEEMDGDDDNDEEEEEEEDDEGEKEGDEEEEEAWEEEDDEGEKEESKEEDEETKEEDEEGEQELECDGGNNAEETWQPSVEGYLKYLVDSKLVFDTLDKIVDEATHVAYADFRKLGLERSDALSKDIEWFSQQGYLIPEPSSPGVSYAKYLREISETSLPAFLSHFYNIYFAHISGGQVIGKQVSENILENKELEFYKWEDDVPVLLKTLREKLNKLGEQWTRDEKNKCLREAAKSFKFSGQIIRLIIT